MAAEALTKQLKQEAQRLGFTLMGVCPAVTATGFARLQQWLAAGYAGEMSYFSERLPAYAHPNAILDGVRSLLMLGLNYRTQEPATAGSGAGRVSRYAWGAADYHDLLHPRLRQLGRYLTERVPEARVRGVVDSAPLLEREFARRAGLGWIGKHTLLINRQAGSWFFLAALLTDVELAYDAPHSHEYCGECRACLDACPTGAFPEPYVLDATRCLSYLTIELRAAIPTSLRGHIGDHVFGCDICQEVCPWNRRGESSAEPALEPVAGRNPLSLAALFQLTDESFRRLFRHSPLWRSKRRGLLRNAALVLGNQQASEALLDLIRGLHDDESLVRAACAWALGRFSDSRAAEALRQRLDLEADADVRAELIAAEAQAQES